MVIFGILLILLAVAGFLGTWLWLGEPETIRSYSPSDSAGDSGLT